MHKLTPGWDLCTHESAKNHHAYHAPSDTLNSRKITGGAWHTHTRAHTHLPPSLPLAHTHGYTRTDKANVVAETRALVRGEYGWDKVKVGIGLGWGWG